MARWLFADGEVDDAPGVEKVGLWPLERRSRWLMYARASCPLPSLRAISQARLLYAVAINEVDGATPLPSPGLTALLVQSLCLLIVLLLLAEVAQADQQQGLTPVSCLQSLLQPPGNPVELRRIGFVFTTGQHINAHTDHILVDLARIRPRAARRCRVRP